MASKRIEPGTGSGLLSVLLNGALFNGISEMAVAAIAVTAIAWLAGAIFGWLVWPYFLSKSQRYRRSDWQRLILRVLFASAYGGLAAFVSMIITKG